MTRRRDATLWVPLAALVLAEIGYPLVAGTARAGLVVATVVLGYLASVTAAALTRGARAAAVLVLVTTGGGLAVEALGVATGVPFGSYAYGEALGPTLVGVPVIIPLAWTWMAWPAWLAAGRVVRRSLPLRVLVAGVGLAGWDLFLDPQMVTEGYWTWADPHPALPGVPQIPVSNYLGWLVVAIVLMALLAWLGGPAVRRPAATGEAATGDAPTGQAAKEPGDAPMLALYLWTYASSVLAHAVFLGLPASAAWGGLAMGLVAVPLATRLWLDRRRR
ncbi:MAG TPA: carotenoid biosynthesis protein [Micromonosporaceae bacterium]|nr:carotenoid biosynthesis protein [Micromonosporaceae bacterium]